MTTKLLMLSHRTGRYVGLAFDESKHPRGQKGTHEGGRFVESTRDVADNIGATSKRQSDDSHDVSYSPKRLRRELEEAGYERVGKRKIYRSHNDSQEHMHEYYSDGQTHVRVVHNYHSRYGRQPSNIKVVDKIPDEHLDKPAESAEDKRLREGNEMWKKHNRISKEDYSGGLEDRYR